MSLLQDLGLGSDVSETLGSNGDVGDGTTQAGGWLTFGTDFGSSESGGAYIPPGTVYGPTAPAPVSLPAATKTGTPSVWNSLLTNLTAGAAAIGLATLGRSAGVSNAYASSSAAALLQKPGSVSPTQAALTAQTATTPFLFMGFLVVIGLVIYAATKTKE